MDDIFRIRCDAGEKIEWVIRCASSGSAAMLAKERWMRSRCTAKTFSRLWLVLQSIHTPDRTLGLVHVSIHTRDYTLGLVHVSIHTPDRTVRRLVHVSIHTPDYTQQYKGHGLYCTSYCRDRTQQYEAHGLYCTGAYFAVPAPGLYSTRVYTAVCPAVCGLVSYCRLYTRVYTAVCTATVTVVYSFIRRSSRT